MSILPWVVGAIVFVFICCAILGHKENHPTRKKAPFKYKKDSPLSEREQKALLTDYSDDARKPFDKWVEEGLKIRLPGQRGYRWYRFKEFIKELFN